MEAVFWISLSVLFYTYLGYGLLLLLYRVFTKRKKITDTPVLPPVTLIVFAYNEEAVIEQKIQNCLLLRYPEHRLRLLFITDGSTDNTPAMVARHSRLTHLHEEQRKGKTAALNRAMQAVETPFVVFTDANAFLGPDSLRKIVRHYQDAAVGGVSGEKRMIATDSTAVTAGEGLYWQYESVLKKADAGFYTVMGAAGELYSIRTALFEPLDESVILDDFFLFAHVCLKGYRFAYEGEAYALETASENIREEQTRKVRIGAGCFQALWTLKGLLNPRRHWKLTFQYLSRRVLRWTLCPLLAPLLLSTNAWLFFHRPQPVYVVFFWLQALFYLLAVFGWLLAEKKGWPRVLFIPCYFVFMNLSLYQGFYRFLQKKQPAAWAKAVRKKQGRAE